MDSKQSPLRNFKGASHHTPNLSPVPPKVTLLTLINFYLPRWLKVNLLCYRSLLFISGKLAPPNIWYLSFLPLRMTTSASEKCETNVNICFVNLFAFLYCGYQHPLQKNVKRMSTSISLIFLLFLYCGCWHPFQEKYETDVDIRFVNFFLLFFIMDVDICFKKL